MSTCEDAYHQKIRKGTLMRIPIHPVPTNADPKRCARANIDVVQIVDHCVWYRIHSSAPYMSKLNQKHLEC